MEETFDKEKQAKVIEAIEKSKALLREAGADLIVVACTADLRNDPNRPEFVTLRHGNAVGVLGLITYLSAHADEEHRVFLREALAAERGA